MWPHPIRAVVFDCDGVLIESLSVYLKGNEFVTGVPYPKEMIKLTNGRNEKDVAKIVVSEMNLDMTPEEFLDRRREYISKYLPDCELIPNVEKIVRELHKRNIPMAVATSASREFHMLKTSKHRELFSLFKYEVCGNEVHHAKPDPEIFQVAAAQLGTFKPENVLVMEDALMGIKAAAAAKMPAVLLDSLDFMNVAELADAEGVPYATHIADFREFNFDLFDWEGGRTE